MRAMWEVLKRFPHFPPFGPEWFGALTDLNDPLGDLRLSFVLISSTLDREAENTDRREMLDYVGWFVSPERWALIRGEKSAKRAGGGLEVVEEADRSFGALQAAAVDGRLVYGDAGDALAFLAQAEAQGRAVASAGFGLGSDRSRIDGDLDELEIERPGETEE